MPYWKNKLLLFVTLVLIITGFSTQENQSSYYRKHKQKWTEKHRDYLIQKTPQLSLLEPHKLRHSDDHSEYEGTKRRNHLRSTDSVDRSRRSGRNRHEPRFQYNEYLAHLDENVPNRTVVLQVSATDEDLDENGVIIYELLDTTDFVIDSGGVIYTNNRLDYESTGGAYRFRVWARNPVPNSRGTRVPVILQIRDNPEQPHFDSDSYEFSISEFAIKGDYVGTVVAIDDDNDFDRYELSDVNPPNLFKIDRVTGIITVWMKAGSFNIYVYHFRALAIDKENQSTSVPVTVNVIDENTNRPTFENCSSYNNFHLKENQTAPAPVFIITATDDDYGPNGEVRYSLLDAEGFSIDPITGQLTVQQVLDREKGQKEIFLTVIAQDMGENPLQGSCSFTIIVEDVNDNAPIFDQQSYQQTIPADSQTETVILRLTATDADVGANAVVSYSLEGIESDLEYFEINSLTGFITLNKALALNMANSKVFHLTAKAQDNGTPLLFSRVPLLFEIITPGDVPPSVVKQIPDAVSVPEDAILDTRIVTICARSNYQSDTVYMDFLNGNIPETNSEGTFDIRKPTDSSAAGCDAGQVAGDIFLATTNLDYEEIQSYTLTIQLMNDKNVQSVYTLTISVIDVNDMPPVLHQPYSTSVSENMPPTLVLTVKAIDKDISPEFRQLTYQFNNPPPEVTEFFELDSQTGELRTTKELDREKISQYRIPIQVSDGVHVRERQYMITVNDVNDEPPVINYEDGIYEAQVNEDLEVGKPTGIVIVVDDPDIRNEFSYQIVSGNAQEKFKITNSGLVLVNKPLDYDEPVNDRNFTLGVHVSDGRSLTSANVTIIVVNVNDLPPVFDPSRYNVTVRENKECNKVITQVHAYDPDYPETGGEIMYYLNLDQKRNFSIDENTAEISIKGCLDREATKPIGMYVIYPYASDEGGSGRTAANGAVFVNIEDENDNHPYIQSPGRPITIMENKEPSLVTPKTLQLDDVDSKIEGNGCPCYLEFDSSASKTIRETFSITNGSNPNQYLLWTMKELDREAIKYYDIPFRTRDNNGLSGIRYQRIDVGDVNDSPMTDGESKINVYNYKSSFPSVIIGSVYVTDADDYDISDKTFEINELATSEETRSYFEVSFNLGNITMHGGTPGGNYILVVKVKDNLRNEDANGTVHIKVIDLPERAVLESGSFLIDNVTSIDMISQTTLSVYEGTSIYDRVKASLAGIYDVPVDNVDIFNLVDYVQSPSFGVKVRFNVHGSPYYISGHLNGLLLQEKERVEQEVGINIPVVDDNRCLYEDFESCNRTSCQQEILASSNEPLIISYETSTLVGVTITVNYVCQCGELFPPYKACPPHSENYCLNGGTCQMEGHEKLSCKCPDEYNYGPRCELLTARMKGGYAWFNAFGSCQDPSLKMRFQSEVDSAVLLYNGPIVPPPNVYYPRDFIYIILEKWILTVYIDLGNITNRVSVELEGSTFEEYDLMFSWNSNTLRLEVPNCGRNTSLYPNACSKTVGILSNEASILNVGGPLQLGGLSPMYSLYDLGSYYGWDYTLPVVEPFRGCFSFLQYNNETYDLNATSYYKDFYRTCSEVTTPPKEIKMSSESVVIIVGSLLLLLLLVLILLIFLRKKKKPTSYPDHLNEIVKETIGTTDLEGYGEKDMTHFDINMLRVTPDGQLINGHGDRKDLPDVARQKPGKKAPLARLSEGLGIGEFILDKTKQVDKEHPDFDDVRHYCFEGDRSSVGSLSSLGSGSSGDGDYNYLEDWGPRFKKLAEMYGPQPDEEIDSDYEFPPVPKKNASTHSSRPSKQSPTSPKSPISSSSTASGGTSITQVAPSDVASTAVPSVPYTRILPHKPPESKAEPPRVLRGEYHEAVNPLGAYEDSKESWC